MKYFIESASGACYEIELEDLGRGRFRLRSGDREWEADYHDVDHLGQCAVILDHASYGASVEGNGDGTELRVRIAGRSYSLKVLDERERAAGALSRVDRPRTETIQAAMPGLLVSLRVQLGDTVQAGQAVAVLEAMKMQNEVVSENGGVVAELVVEEGQSVSGGQLLMRIEPPPE